MSISLPEPIRPATEEEVKAIAANSDLGPYASVLKFKDHAIVVRTVTELDPVYFAPDSSVREKAMFIWGVENVLRSNGVPQYYFNVLASDEEWIETVKHWGAVATSTAPEYRFKRIF